LFFLKRGIFVVDFDTASYAAPQIPMSQRTLGLDPGLHCVKNKWHTEQKSGFMELGPASKYL
jgi:hypothetical protein